MSAKKSVLITGCSTGSIGEALAKQFHHRGWHVIATARSLTRLEPLKQLGCQIEVLDVTSTESIQRLRSKITNLDFLINNAGACPYGMISDLTSSQWRAAFEINFFSAVNVTQAFMPLLIESKSTIVNHTSSTAYHSFPGCSPYGVTKSALRAYTDHLRLEMYPFGVRVVELITGVVGSNMIVKDLPSGTTKVPESSLYYPVHTGIEKGWALEPLGGKYTQVDEYAKAVVSDLFDGPGMFGWLGARLGYEKPWMWKGYLSSFYYWSWLAGCGWKGLMDTLFRLGPMNSLKAMLEKDKQL
jgi:1-acylglycerone phosphate reductase